MFLVVTMGELNWNTHSHMNACAHTPSFSPPIPLPQNDMDSFQGFIQQFLEKAPG